MRLQNAPKLANRESTIVHPSEQPHAWPVAERGEVDQYPLVDRYKLVDFACLARLVTQKAPRNRVCARFPFAAALVLVLPTGGTPISF